MTYEPCEHTPDTCDSCALRQAEARIEKLERALLEIEGLVFFERGMTAVHDIVERVLGHPTDRVYEAPKDHAC